MAMALSLSAPLVRCSGASSSARIASAKPACAPFAARARNFPKNANGSALSAASESETAITGVIFEPFTEVQSELQAVPSASDVSFARQNFDVRCEAAINDQINIEYNNSYVYHALYAYFDRDNVGLPGFAAYFKDASVEEREHAEMLMEYQNVRGGKVKLQSILLPEMEFGNVDRGDALYAMELALALERLTNDKLLALHAVADECGDAQMTDHIEGNFLQEQVEAIKEVSEMVSQLRRVGQGHGVWDFDRQLLEKVKAAAGAA